MKAKQRILIALVGVSLLTACGGQQNRVKQETDSQSTVNIENIKSMDSLYSKLPEITLPFVYTDDLVEHTPDYLRLPQALSNQFTSISGHASNNSIARLPEREDLKPVIIYYCDSLDHTVIDMYTLSSQLKPLQYTTLYSIEGEGNSKGMITRKFTISPDYIIHVYKELGDTLIESLYYEIDALGNFIEIRDGKTRITTFESFDNTTYYVESFIWEKTPKGGLQKNDLEKSVFEVTPQWEVIKVRK